MKKFKTTLILLFMIITNSVYSCDCNWWGNFIKVNQNSELTIIGKVIKRYNYDKDFNRANYDDISFYHKVVRESIIIEVIKVLQGKETRKEIEIFSGDGSECLESTHQYQIDKFYVFSLNTTHYSELNMKQKEVSFYLYNCFESWLKYDSQKEEVIGWITGKKRNKKKKMALSKFVEKVNKRKNY